MDLVRGKDPDQRSGNAEGCFRRFCRNIRDFVDDDCRIRFHFEFDSFRDHEVGDCILSATWKWEFDLTNASLAAAVGWCVNRIQELAMSFCPSEPVEFPDPNWDNPDAWCWRETPVPYDPFWGSGPRMRLDWLGVQEPIVQDVALLAHWAAYVVRWEASSMPPPHFMKWLPKPYRFLPLSSNVGSMVRHNDFTERVAHQLYGVFPSCGIWLQMARSRSHFDDPFTVNGLTVLFLACSMIFDPVACSKLLQMPSVGLVILKDLEKNGLGHFCQETVKPIIEPLLDAMYFGKSNLTMRAWGQRLSLLLSMHVCRHDGALAKWEQTDYIESLLLDVLKLGPSRVPNIPIEYEAAAVGFFCGTAVGTLVQHLAKQITAAEARATELKARVALSAEWGQNLINVGETVAPLAVGTGGPSATPFSLSETQAWLQSKIDDRMSSETRALRNACEEILALADERTRRFRLQFCGEVDLDPFLAQASQALMLALTADPQTHFERSRNAPFAMPRSLLLMECPAEFYGGIGDNFWRGLFEQDLSLVDRRRVEFVN